MAYEQYKPYDYTQNYDNIAKARKAALDSAYEAQAATINAQRPELENQYKNLRAQTYANARLSAIGNNEALAANGLAGNMYSNPTSGYSETSRIAENNALRNALANANQQQVLATTALDNQITQAGLARDQAYQNQLADLEAQRLNAAQAENQFAAQYNLNVQQANDAAAQQAKQNALNELQYFGKIISQAAADALGVPVGTTYNSMKVSSGVGSRSPAQQQNPNLLNDIDEFMNNNSITATPTTTTKTVNTELAPTNNLMYNYQRRNMR